MRKPDGSGAGRAGLGGSKAFEGPIGKWPVLAPAARLHRDRCSARRLVTRAAGPRVLPPAVGAGPSSEAGGRALGRRRVAPCATHHETRVPETGEFLARCDSRVAQSQRAAAARQVDTVGDAYLLVCSGPSSGGPPPPAARAQLLSAALALRRAAAALDHVEAAAAAAAGRQPVRMRVRIGAAQGQAAAGLTGALRQRFHFAGPVLARAEACQRRAQPGEVRVAAPLAEAAAADGFVFAAAGSDGDGPAGDVLLVGEA
jgi:class 3 adenylate cyclase